MKKIFAFIFVIIFISACSITLTKSENKAENETDIGEDNDRLGNSGSVGIGAACNGKRQCDKQGN